MSPFEGFEASPRIYVPTDPYYAEGAAGIGFGTDSVAIRAAVPKPNRPTISGISPSSSRPSPPRRDVDAARDRAVEYLESEADASEFVGGGEDLEVTFQTSTELLQQLQDILELLQNFIVGIAAISLLVGSIGIANIMLVSVTERTREIGIMKAVGAQNREVLGLFLAEAVILGVVGAVLGTALGLLAGYLGALYVDLPLVYPSSTSPLPSWLEFSLASRDCIRPGERPARIRSTRSDTSETDCRHWLPLHSPRRWSSRSSSPLRATASAPSDRSTAIRPVRQALTSRCRSIRGPFRPVIGFGPRLSRTSTDPFVLAHTDRSAGVGSLLWILVCEIGTKIATQ